MVAAFGLGGGWEAVDRAIEYSKTRNSGGSPLAEKQGYTHKLIVPHVARLEAARVLAERLVRAHPGDEEGQVVEAFRRLTSERPNGEQTRVLTAFLKDELARAARQTEAERTAVLANGEVAVAEDVKSTEVVAATMMVRLLLGYTETTTIP